MPTIPAITLITLLYLYKQRYCCKQIKPPASGPVTNRQIVMTREQLNTTGYIYLADKRSIEVITYKNYLNEYGSDTTTTPNGVSEVLHIKEIDDSILRNTVTGEEVWGKDYDELGLQWPYEFVGDTTHEYQIWEWYAHGSRRRFTGTSFSNEEDAVLYLYECTERHLQEHCWNAPIWHEDYEDAVTDMVNILDRPEDVVRRYLAIAAITARKERERRQQADAAAAAHKARMAVEVPAEAAGIVIDEEFKAALQWAAEASGTEKSQRCASALKGLLERNCKDKIDTDFWQVFRILKARAEQQGSI